jgi:hypothetical protein
MLELRVSLQQPSAHGRLSYRDDPQIRDELIVLKSAYRERWSYFVNLNGGMVQLRLDAQHILRSVEVLIPRAAWIVAPALAPPASARAADLALPAFIHRHTYQDGWPVAVQTNALRSYANIRFGAAQGERFWVALSDHCFALVVADQLSGFFVVLPDPAGERTLN